LIVMDWVFETDCATADNEKAANRRALHHLFIFITIPSSA
jgi:hypothetical protein